ncbi:hypothetical protein GCM10023224_40720 [Streptomonospora halophila]|uniref:Resolvase/invertase-type recombinase catalytic domain-containing protein n=1 Tax=Streptomonospora halophila TaxID=427369 RepID=A0ABP9GT25_9ACTN
MAEIDLYARKSKILAQGDRLREVSTDEQLRQGRKWAADHGFTVRREHVELGSAYGDRERPQFQAAVRGLLAGEVPALWCFMYDRFSRKGVEDLIQVLGKARVVFAWDDLDTMRERDRGQLINEAERARDYSRRLSARVSGIKGAQRDAGEWLGGSAPWGLAVDRRTRKLAPDVTPAGGTCFRTRGEMARLMLAWLTAGVSARQIARDLNGMRVPGPRGQYWYPATILQMLRSPAYAGLQVAGGDRKGVTVPFRNAQGHTVSVGEGVATVAEQAAALAAVARASVSSGRRPGGRARHLLTDLLTCAGCTGPMACVGSAYACLAKKQGKHCPAPARVGKDVIEDAITEAWRYVLSACEPDDDLAAVVAERWAALTQPEETAEHQAAKAAVAAAETVRARLQKAFTAGAYENAEDLFADEMKAATAALRDAQEALSATGQPRADVSFIDDEELIAETWNASALSTRRDLLRLAIDRVTVRQAEYRGQRFDFGARVAITWAAPA